MTFGTARDLSLQVAAIPMTSFRMLMNSPHSEFQRISPQKRACLDWCGQLPGRQLLPLDYFLLTFPSRIRLIGGLPTIRSYVNKATDEKQKE